MIGGIWISEGIGIWGLTMTGSSVRLEKDVTGEMGSSSGSGSGEVGRFLVLTMFLVFTTVVVALFALAGAVVIRVVVFSKKKWKRPTVATLETERTTFWGIR